jgi:hypothetical protein
MTPQERSNGEWRERRGERRSLVGVDAVSGDFDLGDTAERKKQLNEVSGWLFGGLFYDVGDGVGNRGLKHHTPGLDTG